MARPRRTGLDYFPLDVDFFGDRKIKILKGRFGADGVTFYLYILCEIYKDAGYYLKHDDDFQYAASADLNMNSEKIGQMLNFLLERSLLDSKLFQSDTVLTSHGIQARYQEAIKERAKKTPVMVNKKFWLLSKEETQSYINCTNFEGFSENNDSFSEKNKQFFQEKCTKGKERKGKEIKEEERRGKEATPTLYGSFSNVKISTKEEQELRNNYENATDLINKISEYLANSEKTYGNHYALICKIAREDQWPKKKKIVKGEQVKKEAVPMPDEVREKMGMFYKRIGGTK